MANARDARDPQAIGNRLADWRDIHPEDTRLASEILDDFALNLLGNIPDVDPGESTVQSTMRQYREDLAREVLATDSPSARAALYRLVPDLDERTNLLRSVSKILVPIEQADLDLAFRKDPPEVDHWENQCDEREPGSAAQTFMTRNHDRDFHHRPDVLFEDPDPGDADRPRMWP